MNELSSYQKLIEKALKAFSLPEAPNNLYDPLRYFLGIGGKRIRPALTLMALKAFGGNPEDGLHAALSVELFHNFTLIHDDIMDAAPLRRGNETVHTKWNANVAILSGDVLLIKAYEEICKHDVEYLPRLLELFNKTSVEVCEGQQYDMDFETQEEVRLEEYIQMIKLKTSVLLGCAFKMGAILADTDQRNQELIYNFGVHLGIAFQIQDDILDLYADQAQFGKQVGGDVLSGKKAVLYIKALELASSEDKNEYKDIYNLSNSESRVNAVKIFNDRYGVKEACEDLKLQHYNTAIEFLNQIDLNADDKRDLEYLANYLIQREK